MGAGTLMLVYTVAEETLLAWSVRAGGVELNAVDCSAPRLRELVSAALTRYAAGTLGDEAAASAQLALADVLLAPVAHRLADGVDHVVVVPDGPLAYLPFRAAPGRRRVICWCGRTPSATARRPPYWTKRYPREGAGIGRWPPSSGSARGVTGSTLLLGARATEANLVRHVGGHDVVHLATHMVLDDERPLVAGLAMAPPDESRCSIGRWPVVSGRGRRCGRRNLPC